MSRRIRSWRLRAAGALFAVVVGGLLIFAPFGPDGGPLGTGQQKITAQAATVQQGTAVNISLQRGASARLSDALAPRAGGIRPERQEEIERREAMNRAGMQARAAALPASDPRVQAGPAPNAAAMTVPRGALRQASDPGPMAPADAVAFETTQITGIPSGFSSAVNEPAVAQNGKGVLYFFNWYAAQSLDGGNTFPTLFDPEAPVANPAFNMPDFCCDQDVIYDKGVDRVFWERLGIGGFACGAGCTENRTLVTVIGSDFNTLQCNADLRGSTFGLTDAFMDYPRMSLSDKFLYIQWNIFHWDTGAYVTHLLARFDLALLGSCTSATGTFWAYPEGWTPALIEGAKEVMYLGDQVITTTGLNNQFNVSWIFDDNTTRSTVTRTLADSFQFTQGPGGFQANCPVPGGANPCARADHRVIGAVLAHNTPVPGGLGAAADAVTFFWNVKEGNGFTLPYVESATFHGGTILQTFRRLVFNPAIAFFYAAAGANDRQHTALSLLAFYPSSPQPQHLFGIDDDYNSNPPGWEVYVLYTSTGNWIGNQSGDYMRGRLHSPAGGAWIVSGYTSTGSGSNFRPHYAAVGRLRDLNGYTRFATQ